MMSRATHLFLKIKQAGEAAIDDLIAQRVSEELFLDFKRSADGASGSRLHADDRKNLSRAISGFGNADGGVIIWGVDCRPHLDRGDVAHEKHSLVDAIRFKSWLEGIVSGCTIPPHGRVEHAVIKTHSALEAPAGFVATLIEQAPNLPLQATTDGHYYMRAGSSFERVPHGVLAGMFGRPPFPHLRHHWDVRVVERGEQFNNTMVIKATLQVRNVGPGLARDIFASVELAGKLRNGCRCEIAAVQATEWHRSSVHGRVHSIIANENVRLSLGGVLDAFEVTMTLPSPPAEDLTLECTVGCGNGLPEYSRVHCEAASLARVRNDFFAAMPTQPQYQAKPAREFGRRIFALPQT